MNVILSTLARRYRTLGVVVVGGLAMLLGFLWYLPGAFHASAEAEYHVYSWRALRFTNVLDLYVLHNLDGASGSDYILAGTGLDYPPLLSLLARATAQVSATQNYTGDQYRAGTPPSPARPGASVPGYLILNYAVIFLGGLATLLLLARRPGARPWLFALSPVLLVYAGYNWDLIPMALVLAGLALLERSTARPDPGRSYNLWLETGGFALLTLAVWFKLFPAVFVAAALLDRARRWQWRAVAAGAGTAAVLSVACNLPLMLANYNSWLFYIWFNANRPAEPSSLWYLLFGRLDLAAAVQPATTAAINIASLLTMVGGGLVLAVFAWRGPRRDLTLPLGGLLLLWWLTFNKIYDPNFDLWVLFVLAVFGARAWLAGQLIPLSLAWYVTAIGGLAFLSFDASDALNAWYVSHTLMFMIVWRLVVLGIVIVWGVRRLLSAEEGVASSPPAAGAVLPNTAPAAPTGGKLLL